MSRKAFWVILIPALLLIMGYIALQVFLRTGETGNKDSDSITAQSTASKGGKRATENGTTNALIKQDDSPEEKEGSNHTEAGQPQEKKDTLAGKKLSPLDLRPLFIQKMQQLVKKSSNGLYDLAVGNLEVDVLASTVSLHNVSLRPDQQAVQKLKASGLLPETVLTASLERLLIDGINLDDATNSKSMDYKLIKLVNPQIRMERHKAKKQKSKEDFCPALSKEDKQAVYSKGGSGRRKHHLT